MLAIIIKVILVPAENYH